MSKIAKYLNGHIFGEISAKESRLRHFSKDRSIIQIEPELVLFPRIADDIRKIMRFSWQLAEKNHIISVTARGFGGSTDGSSIGSGVLVDMSRHMDNIRELDMRSKMVTVQAGANFQKLNLAIGAQAMHIPQSPAGERLTVGGAISMNLPSEKYNYGSLVDVTKSLKVVLSNGDSITTGRISKKELSQKLALQTFEGDIYRGVDALIEDKSGLVSDIGDGSYGYHGISKVKKSDGSFDLTPLFFGSLGTLGVITEATFGAEFIVNETGFMVIAFSDRDDSRDFVDEIKKFNPDIIEMFDGKMFEAASASGKKYQFYLDRISKNLSTKMVLAIGISAKNAKKIHSIFAKIKKVIEKFEGSTCWIPESTEEGKAELESVRDVREVLRSRSGVIKEEIYPIQGVKIPLGRFEEFYRKLQKIGLKYDIPVPIQGSALTSIFEILAEFDFSKVSERRKSLQFLVDLNALVSSVEGEFGYGSGEGRIYGSFVTKYIGKDLAEVYSGIRKIFDPMGILNVGVKGLVDGSELLKNIKNGK